MDANKEQPDKFFLIVVIILVSVGLLMFISASMKLLTGSNSGDFYGNLITQIGLGLVGGGIAAYVAYRIPNAFWHKYSLIFFGISTALLVLVIFIGNEAGDARRWLQIGKLSFQPAEVHKITLVMVLASWFTTVGDRIKTIKFGLLPFIAIIGLTVGILIIHRDMGSIMVMVLSALIVYFAAGARVKHILWLALAGFIMSIALYMSVAYIHNRIDAYMQFPFPLEQGETDNERKWSARAHDKIDVLIGHTMRYDNYQTTQATLGLGSGQLWGRGYLQGQQKLTNLPLPENDTIYAVVGEEFGFVGSVVVLLLYILFLLRGIRISNKAQDKFPRLLALGLVILITSQSFVNIGAILEVLPLTGLPLIFFSHGGTALFFALVTVGIVLNISKTKIKPIKVTKK